MEQQTLAVAVLSARHPAPPLRARYAFTIDILIAGLVGLLLDDAKCNFRLRGRKKKKSFSTFEVATFHHALLSQDERR